MKLIRELVFKTFDGLSDTLDHTNVLIRCYSGDDSLGRKAEDLYIATLDAVKEITTWLRKNPLSTSGLETPCDLADELQRSLSKLSSNKTTMG